MVRPKRLVGSKRQGWSIWTHRTAILRSYQPIQSPSFNLFRGLEIVAIFYIRWHPAMLERSYARERYLFIYYSHIGPVPRLILGLSDAATWQSVFVAIRFTLNISLPTSLLCRWRLSSVWSPTFYKLRAPSNFHFRSWNSGFENSTEINIHSLSYLSFPGLLSQSVPHKLECNACSYADPLDI